tara:strand:+ start:456 stop:620 length:165 start_codon:yes stop_codon:yes gene_type:complete
MVTAKDLEDVVGQVNNAYAVMMERIVKLEEAAKVPHKCCKGAEKGAKKAGVTKT